GGWGATGGRLPPVLGFAGAAPGYVAPGPAAVEGVAPRPGGGGARRGGRPAAERVGRLGRLGHGRGRRAGEGAIPRGGSPVLGVRTAALAQTDTEHDQHAGHDAHGLALASGCETWEVHPRLSGRPANCSAGGVRRPRRTVFAEDRLFRDGA